MSSCLELSYQQESNSSSTHTGHLYTRRLASVIPFPYVDATGCRGANRSWRSTSTPFPMMRTGVLGTTLPGHSSSPVDRQNPLRLRPGSIRNFDQIPVLSFWLRNSETRGTKLDIRKQVVAEIARLNKILALLDDSDDVPVQGQRIKKLRRKMSSAGRRRIAAAQKARWAKIRAQK